MLVDASVRFMESEHPLSTVRRCADGETYDDEAYRHTAAELGWFGLLADDAHGGGSMSGNGLLDAALIARRARCEAAAGTVRGPQRRRARADDRSVAARRDRGARERRGVGDVDRGLRALVHRARRRRRRSASPAPSRWWPTPRRARGCSSTRAGDDGVAQVLVRTDASGVTLRPLEGLDVTRRWFGVELDGVVVDRGRAARVAGLGEVAAVLSAAESVGAMQADFDVALDYAKDRIAFGRPIGSFQAIKHLLADTSLGLEMSKAPASPPPRRRSGSGAPDGPEVASMAKAFVGERRRRARPELLPGVRRHRVHVGARPAPLPPAPHRRRRAASGRRRAHRRAAARHRGGGTMRRHRDEPTPDESRARRVPRAGPRSGSRPTSSVDGRRGRRRDPVGRRRRDVEHLAVRARAAATAVRSRVTPASPGRGVRRPGTHARPRARVPRGGGGLRAARSRHRRRRDARRVRADDAGARVARLPRAATSRRCSRATRSWAQFFSEPERRLRPRGRADAGRSRRRPLDPQRRQDLEQRRGLRRLRHVPGAHQLGRAEAPGPHLVRGAAPTRPA